jgi:hypothetical protein
LGEARGAAIFAKLQFFFLFYFSVVHPSRLTFSEKMGKIILTMATKEGTPWTLAVMAIYPVEVDNGLLSG